MSLHGSPEYFVLWTIYMFPGFSETEFIKVVIAVKYILHSHLLQKQRKNPQ